MLVQRKLRVEFSSILWLGLGAVLWGFSVGRFIVPIAAWLSPVFLLRFSRLQKPFLGYLAMIPAVSLANFLAWFSVATKIMPLPLYAAFILLYTAVFLTPYLLDRLISARLSGFIATLVFPLAWTSMEYLVSMVSPLGTWGSFGYTQFDNLPLLQILSVTGLWGVSFLLHWLAAVANWSWEQRFYVKQVGRGVSFFAGLLALVLLAGGVRLVGAPDVETVRVATITRSNVVPAPIITRIAQGTAAEDDIAEYRAISQGVADDLLARSKGEAVAGAKIVFWAEASAFSLEEDEAAFIEKGRALARSEQIYLGMQLFTANHTDNLKKPFKLKTILIGPTGEVYPEYLKRYQVPGSDAATILSGDGIVPVVETPYGRIASTICYDLDFPAFIRQAGQGGLDIMFGPSSDWEAIKYQHGRQAMYRAIENGFSLIRPTNFGISTAHDYYGRPLGFVDSFVTKDKVMVTYVPIKGTVTFYSRYGDWFAWGCLAGLALAALGSTIGGSFFPGITKKMVNSKSKAS